MNLPKLRNLSMRSKLVLIILFVATLISVVQIVLFSSYDAKSYLEARILRTQVMARIVGLNSMPALKFGDKNDAKEILQSFDADRSIRSAYLFDARGSLIAEYLHPGEISSVPTIVPRGQDEILKDESYIYVHDIKAGDDHVGSLYLTTDLSEIEERKERRLFIGLATAGICFFLSAILAYRLQSLLSRPLAELSATIAEVANQKIYSLRAKKRADDELGRLVDGFNLMLGEIESRDKVVAQQLVMVEESNRDLDRRVNKRTAELTALNKELESFSYSVSHDLRAPLRSIEGFSQILLKDFGPKLDSEAQRLLGIVCADVQRMGCLIDDLLAFSRMSRQQMTYTTIDMNELTERVFTDLKSRLPNRSIRFQVGDLPLLRGDMSMIRQVLFNLLSNALKFSSTRECSVIEVEGRNEETQVVYSIKDNGVGFDTRFKEKLFGVFQRLHSEEEFEGTGVGLALVQRIVQRHGGEVSADSELEKGAIFYLTFLKNREHEWTRAT